MPNWCHNEIAITGNQTEISKLLKKALDEDLKFSLQNLLPCPAELLNTDAGGSEFGYDVLYGPDSIWKKASKYEWVIKDNKNKTPSTRKKVFEILRKHYRWKIEEIEVYKRNVDKFGFKTWYDWKIENWGTKWDLCERSEITQSDNYAWFSCDTAWSPPENAFQTISKNYPKLTFEINYDEPGMELKGKIVIKNGVILR